MLSTKTKRSAPPKVLENYVASIKRLQGSPISISDLGFPSGQFISSGATTTPSDINNIDIGFVVKINDINYNRAYISEYGHLALIEGSTSFSTTDVYIAPGGNNTINSSFTKNHILICPWWDNAAVPPKDVDTLAASSEYNGTLNTAQEVLDIKNGIDLRNWPFSPYDRGARYKIINDSQNGKCFVVRWTISQSLFGNKLKFEAAIYENGKFQFRYWPIEEYQQGDSIATTSATVGVFWSGPKFGSDKFRDLSPLIDYKKNLRQLNELGGASYDSSYSEIFKPYSNEISKTYWPGPAEITFSPPVNSVKFLPKKSIRNISDSRDITTTSGLFDDRRTINFSSNAVVHMPSTLPTRLLGDSGGVDVSIRQHLYTSGSLQVTGAVNKSAVDGLLAQINAEQEARTSADFSFDESKKNYELTSFYMTGSALAQFGEGFTSPLTSKTQFQLSLPVEKAVEMLSTTSSLYYYDVERKSWDLISNPYINKNLRSIVGGGALGGLKGSDANAHVGPPDRAGSAEDKYYGYYSYPVTETSVGFDSVGRKIVSGTYRDRTVEESIAFMATVPGGNKQGDVNASSAAELNGVINYSDPRIGKYVGPINSYTYKLGLETELRADPGQIFLDPYEKSITDSSEYFPANSQKILLGNKYPFLIEKVVLEIPIRVEGDWFLDLTRCSMPYAVGGEFDGQYIGPIDLGGPGITVSLHSSKKAAEKSYLDLISSGTITHIDDDIKSYCFEKPTGADFYEIAPVGFRCFSTPTAVISGTYKDGQLVYEGKVRLEMQPSVSSGVIFAKHDRSQNNDSSSKVQSNYSKAIDVFTRETIGISTITQQISTNYGEGGMWYSGSILGSYGDNAYLNRIDWTYVQQISPYSRGTSRIEFNGNSILRSPFSPTNLESLVDNPIKLGSTESELPAEITSGIADPQFGYNAVFVYSTTDSSISPYLLFPEDKLTISISKTRPALRKVSFDKKAVGFFENIPGTGFYFLDPNFSRGFFSGPNLFYYPEACIYNQHELTGSHDTVTLNTGSIDITLYGSYVSAGAEYHE